MKNLIIFSMVLSSYFLQAQIESVTVELDGNADDLLIMIDGTFSDPTGELNGTIEIGLASVADNDLFFAAPLSGTIPAFRQIVAADLPIADASSQGIVTIADQAFAGLKSFNNGIGISTNKRIYFSGTSFIQAGGTDDESVFIGKDAGGDASGGHDNVGIGFNALKNLSNTIGEGNHNTAVGFNALLSLTSALQNTLIGSGAGDELDDTGCDGNTGIGFEVLGMATDAKYNVMIGLKAGKEITTGDNNTYIGYECGKLTTTGSNNILIGNGIEASSDVANDETNIGNFFYHNATGTGIGDQSPNDFFTIGTNSQVQFSSIGNMLTTSNIILNKNGTGVFICGSTTQSYRTTNSGTNLNFQVGFDVDNSTTSPGAKAFGFDPTNGFVFTHANTNGRIAGAAITITNLDNTSGSEDADLSFYTQSAGSAISEKLRITNLGGFILTATNTTAGTTGAQTINKPSGTVNFVAGSTSLVVTNSLVSANSLVFATIRTNDATAIIKNVISTAGSFTINLASSPTFETSVGFFVVN